MVRGHRGGMKTAVVSARVRAVSGAHTALTVISHRGVWGRVAPVFRRQAVTRLRPPHSPMGIELFVTEALTGSSGGGCETQTHTHTWQRLSISVTVFSCFSLFGPEASRDAAFSSPTAADGWKPLIRVKTAQNFPLLPSIKIPNTIYSCTAK